MYMRVYIIQTSTSRQWTKRQTNWWHGENDDGLGEFSSDELDEPNDSDDNEIVIHPDMLFDEEILSTVGIFRVDVSAASCLEIALLTCLAACTSAVMLTRVPRRTERGSYALWSESARTFPSGLHTASYRDL
ncbi:hypothetical protein GQ600_27763 [Phytophthora cactorum]|nr:hypothetical protein GQ600_27763 [Phytophthora cactorum]